jgi:hypothetical protein
MVLVKFGTVVLLKNFEHSSVLANIGQQKQQWPFYIKTHMHFSANLKYNLYLKCDFKSEEYFEQTLKLQKQFMLIDLSNGCCAT